MRDKYNYVGNRSPFLPSCNNVRVIINIKSFSVEELLSLSIKLGIASWNYREEGQFQDIFKFSYKYSRTVWWNRLTLFAEWNPRE